MSLRRSMPSFIACFAFSGIIAGSFALPRPATADEPWLLSFEADLAVPVLSPTMDRFEPGGAASVAVHYALSDAFLLGARARGGFLSDGPAPADTTLADPGVGDLYQLGLSLRMRPFAPLMPGAARGTGGFVELGGGVALTGGVARPTAEAALGWGFAVDEVDLAPVVRWTTVFEVDNQLEDRPAHVLLIGLEVTLFDNRGALGAEEAEIGDRDGDGLMDDVDHCTEEPEDFDGFQDADGCPEPDNDADSLLDPEDACPLEAEDHDGFEDADGCPDRDNDSDQIPDRVDACPDEPEVVNGVEDRDGCPDEGLIEMIDDRIVLDERVLFEFSRSRVMWRAYPVLRALAALQQQHPEWSMLRVEGHADVRGARQSNQRLSEARARSVYEQLIEYGVPAEILTYVGRGETAPRAVGDTEEIHQLNRRVEFVVAARRALTPEEIESEEAAAEEERTAALARIAQGEGVPAPPAEPSAPREDRVPDETVPDEPAVEEAP